MKTPVLYVPSLSSLHSSVLRAEPGSRRSSSSTMLEAGGALGRFDFEVSDFFLFGSPLGLVLALRKTVVPSLDGEKGSPLRSHVSRLFPVLNVRFGSVSKCAFRSASLRSRLSSDSAPSKRSQTISGYIWSSSVSPL